MALGKLYSFGKLAIYFVALIFFLAVFFYFGAAQPAYADPASGDVLDTENTARGFYEYILKLMPAVGGIFLVIGAVIFMMARGNPQKVMQARMGLAAAIGGFLIAVFASPILNWIQSMVKTAG